MSTQDSKLESVLEGYNNYYYYKLLLSTIYNNVYIIYFVFFIGLTILLHDLDSHQLPSIKNKIISMGGVAVNTRSYRGKINYVVVPIVFNEKSLSINATIVSCLWIVSILLIYTNIRQHLVWVLHPKLKCILVKSQFSVPINIIIFFKIVINYFCCYN